MQSREMQIETNGSSVKDETQALHLGGGCKCRTVSAGLSGLARVASFCHCRVCGSQMGPTFYFKCRQKEREVEGRVEVGLEER